MQVQKFLEGLLTFSISVDLFCSTLRFRFIGSDMRLVCVCARARVCLIFLDDSNV